MVKNLENIKIKNRDVEQYFSKEMKEASESMTLNRNHLNIMKKYNSQDNYTQMGYEPDEAATKI